MIQSPAQVVVMMDGYLAEGGGRDPNTLNTMNGLNDDYTIWNDTNRVARGSDGLPRHLGTNNVLYFDGHVKAAVLPQRLNGVPVAPAMEAKLPYKIAIYEGSTNGGDVWTDR